MKWVNSLSFISRLWGQAHDYTVEGFKAMVEQYPSETRFVVWLNPYWGAVESDQECHSKNQKRT